MGALTLHPMKEIRVIVAGEHRAFVTELLDQVKATGYTIIGNVSGKGHHGVREAHFMSSEQESLEMIMTVVPEEKVEPILAGLRPLFERHSGMMLVTDVTVSRQEYFGKKGRSEEEIAALFDRWNNSLKTGDPNKVADNYAPKSVLIATLSKRPRLTREDKVDYFHHFLENKPVGRIDSRSIEFD